MSIALIGHGSIGSKYKDELKRRGLPIDSLKIVDSNTKLLDSLREEGYSSFESIEDMKEGLTKIEFGIIANWGPDHINSANQLLKLGCKKFIIEKPVSNNIEELEQFERISKEKSIFATVHHHLNYLNLIKFIRDAELEYELNNPVGMRLMGGALCLSTNGVHWCDFAVQVLNSYPKTIMADLEIDYINPRDESLAFIGGMSSFKLKNGSFIHISYTNQNSQSSRAEVVYRHGLIDICLKGREGSLKIYRRKKEDIEKFSDQITRHGILDFVGEFKFINKSTIPDVLDDLLQGTSPKVSLERAKVSLKMIIGAIQSSNNNIRVDWDQIKDQKVRIS